MRYIRTSFDRADERRDRRYPLPPRLASQAWLDRLHNPKTGVPYGIALAIAAILVYPQTPLFVRLMSL